MKLIPCHPMTRVNPRGKTMGLQVCRTKTGRKWAVMISDRLELDGNV